MTAATVRKLTPKDEKEIKDSEHEAVKSEIFRHIDEMAEKFLSSRNDTVTIPTRDVDDDNSWHDINISRRSVYLLALNMDSNANISHILGIDRKTVKKHFHTELELARAVMRNKVKAVSPREALNGKNVVDRLFWLKNFGGMSDDGLVEDFDDEVEANFKVSIPPIPEFPTITNSSVDEMLQVIDAGEDQ